MKKVIFYVVSLLIVMVLISLPVLLTSFNDTEYVITVTDKERVANSESSKYLVFAEDEQGNTIVFENTDNLFRFKFDSSDIHGRLKIGNTYKVTVVGFRIPFLSTHQNIIKIEEIKTS